MTATYPSASRSNNHSTQLGYQTSEKLIRDNSGASESPPSSSSSSSSPDNGDDEDPRAVHMKGPSIAHAPDASLFVSEDAIAYEPIEQPTIAGDPLIEYSNIGNEMGHQNRIARACAETRLYLL